MYICIYIYVQDLDLVSTKAADVLPPVAPFTIMD